jgi:hypothetical protein
MDKTCSLSLLGMCSVAMVQTALASPDDLCPWESAPVVTQTAYDVQPRSVVLLVRALDWPGQSSESFRL